MSASGALERVTRRRGTALVLRGSDIDTDQIIPARYMTSVRFDGLERYVFHDARFAANGSAKDHPFNEPSRRGASILVVNRNFGCGSSREHAPQALHRWGIRALVGESFAEIFFGNCTALGIPAVTASTQDIAALMDAVELDPHGAVSVDLAALTVTSRAGTARIQIPASARSALLEGTWDAMRLLLDAEPEILATAAGLPYVSGF
jgi:3-isopropylmalate/(R)-2-methylmalate dehydratase small subunit